MLFSECFMAKSLKVHLLLLVTIACPAFSSAAKATTDNPVGLYVKNGVLMHDGRPYYGIGANYQTLFDNLLKNTDDDSSLKKLARLGKMGIPFVRFRTNGFDPKNQELYLQDRPEFFRRMDQL